MLRKIFKLENDDQIPNNKIYFINTSYDKNNEKFIPRNQNIVDLILKNILMSPRLYHPINTENLDITGANDKIRTQEEIESIEKNIEEIKNKKELAEKEAQKANERGEKIQREIDKLKNQMQRIN